MEWTKFFEFLDRSISVHIIFSALLLELGVSKLLDEKYQWRRALGCFFVIWALWPLLHRL
ncbi:MAG: hypothetical protein HW387_1735 [Parachlamydiales bacterium]|nr:hypothetical protein [Parachlamydiales bacterium]